MDSIEIKLNLRFKTEVTVEYLATCLLFFGGFAYSGGFSHPELWDFVTLAFLIPTVIYIKACFLTRFYISQEGITYPKKFLFKTRILKWSDAAFASGNIGQFYLLHSKTKPLSPFFYLFPKLVYIENRDELFAFLETVCDCDVKKELLQKREKLKEK